MTTKYHRGIQIGLVMAAVIYGVGALLLFAGFSDKLAWGLLSSFGAVAGLTLTWALAVSIWPHLPRLARSYQDPWVEHWETLMQRPCR